MLKYIFKRVLLTLPMIIILMTFVFIVIHSAPGDPATAMLGPRATEDRLNKIREQMGLNKPILQQYFDYIISTFRGDFGKSFVTREPVINLIGSYFPATLELTIYATGVAIIVGLGLGILGAAKSGGVIDFACHTYGILIYAVPVFFSGMLLQLVFGIFLGWLPSSGRIAGSVPVNVTGLYTVDCLITGNWSSLVSSIKYLLLPSITLGLFISGFFVRMTRTNLLQTINKDYTRTARAKGVREITILFKHAFRNALIPVMTIVGMQFALLLGGAILTESTFAWPGLGRFLVLSVNNRDYPAVQGIVTFFAFFVAFISLLIDVLNAYIDPRIHY
ncbi:ABC transporter permease [Candidatus Bipolaricaulota bacterium]|nr:ABC transporter permease [Candidatus Bipolaricaulota bacterium]